MSADGHGVMAIMREAGVSKTTVWRWQEYFVEAGVGGLIKCRTKPPGKKPISAAIKLKIVENGQERTLFRYAAEPSDGRTALRRDHLPVGRHEPFVLVAQASSGTEAVPVPVAALVD